MGKKRKSRTSSGARKARALRYENGNGPSRKKPIADQDTYEFINGQANRRWPTDVSKSKYAELNKAKERRGPARKRPLPLGFPLFETALANNQKAVMKLLVAASLKVKSVRRHPGFILQRTYNLKNRPITII